MNVLNKNEVNLVSIGYVTGIQDGNHKSLAICSIISKYIQESTEKLNHFGNKIISRS